jgi:cytochrome b6-f complex iron-sulfur subunit
METNRREFIKTAGIATVCACTGLATFSGCSMFMGVSDTPVIPATQYNLAGENLILDLLQIDCLREAGSAGKLTLQQSQKEMKIIVLHHKPGKYKVFADKCTHGGRELNYNHTEARLKCSSFGKSTFNADNGVVIKGPAEDALTIYSAEVQKDKLIILI